MVRVVKTFECEWCGESYGLEESGARACEHDCVANENRGFLAGEVYRWETWHPGAESILQHHRERLALYDRLAKEHGIGQEKGR